MGSSVSKNIVDEALSSNVDVTTQIVNSLSTNNSNINKIDLNKGCSIADSTITQQNTFVISAQMSQDSSVTNAIKNAINANIMQQAKVITQNLTLNPASSEAQNITKLFANLATSVSTQVTQSNNGVFFNLNQIGCTDSKIANSTIYQNNMVQDSIIQAQKSVVGNNVYNSLTTAISQTASCTQQDALAAILMWVAIIIGIIVLPAAFGISKVAGKMVQSPAFWGLVGVGGYGGTAYYFKFWPFKSFLQLGFGSDPSCKTSTDCPLGPNKIPLVCDSNQQCRLPPQSTNPWAPCTLTGVNLSGACPCGMFVDESGYCASQPVDPGNNELLHGSHQCPNVNDAVGARICSQYQNCSSGIAGSLCCPQTQQPCGTICCPTGYTCNGGQCTK